jgi:hypothetical protein
LPRRRLDVENSCGSPAVGCAWSPRWGSRIWHTLWNSRSHNPEVAGSNPAPATSEKACKCGPFHLRGGFTLLGDLKRGQVALSGSCDDGTRRCADAVPSADGDDELLRMQARWRPASSSCTPGRPRRRRTCPRGGANGDAVRPSPPPGASATCPRRSRVRTRHSCRRSSGSAPACSIGSRALTAPRGGARLRSYRGRWEVRCRSAVRRA